MVDATKRPIKIPTWQIPYLEKFRIIELFQELARELIVQKPKDHVRFMREVLTNAAASRDVARIIILAPPKVNCYEIVLTIIQITNQIIITRKSVMDYLGKNDSTLIGPELNAKCISQLIRRQNAYKVGWILLDCIREKKEAEALLQLGIIPTHVLHLIPPFHPNLNELLYCNVHGWWPEYRKRIYEIREFFRNILREVHIKHKSIESIAAECIELMKIRGRLSPLKPRVLLIGPRGCGRKTQAKLVEKNLGLIHVDFEYLLCQAWISDTELGKTVRESKDEVSLKPDLMSQVVNKRILCDDCLENGWILTGYPFTEMDFRYLDYLDTPPNRVIFIECDLNICKERLQHRRVNIYTGSTTDIKLEPDAVDKKELEIHPKDELEMINAESSYFCQNYDSLRNYCGNTANVVNGDQCERWVYECIMAIITRATPPYPPRTPFIPESEPSVSSLDSCNICVPYRSKVYTLKFYTSQPLKLTF